MPANINVTCQSRHIRDQDIIPTLGPHNLLSFPHSIQSQTGEIRNGSYSRTNHTRNSHPSHQPYTPIKPQTTHRKPPPLSAPSSQYNTAQPQHPPKRTNQQTKQLPTTTLLSPPSPPQSSTSPHHPTYPSPKPDLQTRNTPHSPSTQFTPT